MKKKTEEKNEKELEQEVLKEEPVCEAENEATEASEEQKQEEEQVSPEELLQNQVNELQKANAELMDQMIRRQAELENYRKRLIRDKEEAVQFANAKLIEDLLTFLDNMDRALAVAKNGGDVKSLIEGLEMSQNQLYSTLDKNWGLKTIESVGKEFDPMLHEACMMAIDESLEKETVLEEFQKGYTLHERVIRPAKVKIGKPE
ncbi:MAG: nucleotide exchange factor GrpE [Sphaerochaetaceae bacterium]|nr:nucleotide exchange factor GrpE [Sphaerochaetaceae bacterium]